MDSAWEADSTAPPSTQDDPPSPDVQEDLSEVDGETMSEDGLKKKENPSPSYPPITVEMFENQFRLLINGEEDDDQEITDFKGYPEKEKNFFFQYTDKKSEIIYDSFKKVITKHKESMLKSANGRIPVPISSKTMKAYLISPRFSPKPVPKIRKNVNPAGERDLKRRKWKVKQNKPKPQKLVRSVINENRDSSVTLPASPSTSSVRASRLIQTPKRYLDGEEERPKTVKRAPRRRVTDKESLFEMGLLHPKYPRKVEMSSPVNGHVDSDLGSQKNPQQKFDNGNGGVNSLFAISRMIHSGELQYAINLHNLEMERKEKLEQLESELLSLPRSGNLTSNKFEFTNESRHSNSNREDLRSFQNSNQCALVMERPAPSSSNSLTIVPLKTIKKPSPPPLVPIPRSSPESITNRSGSVLTITKVKPKALQTSFKAEGNTITIQSQGSVGNISRNKVYPPLRLHPKILPKMANKVGNVGPFPQPPVLTGKTFKKNTMKPKSPQRVIFQDNEPSSQMYSSLPDFMMNFLGSNYGLSSTSGSESILMPPPRSFIWHPEQLIDDLATEEANQRMISFLTKCSV